MKAIKPYDPILNMTPEEAEELNLQSGPHFIQTQILESGLSLVFKRRDWLAHNGFSADLGWKDPRRDTPVSPDLYVVKGIPHAQLNQMSTYVSEGGHPVPCVAIEIGSEFPNERDYREKKAIYETLGVQEYFIFDVVKSRRLVGYRLSGGIYQEIPRNPQGRLASIELQLELGEVEAWARLWDGGELVPVMEEVWDKLGDLQLELEQKDQQLEQKDQQLEQKDQQLEQKEKEIEALKKLLKEKGLL